MTVQRLTAEELNEIMESDQNPLVLDVRSEGAFEGSPYKIPGAVRIPPDEIEARWQELPRDRPIVTYCT